MSKLIFPELSYKILSMAFAVHRAFGPGLLESAYEGAFCVELSHAGIPFERQKVFPLIYRGEYVSCYIADLVIDNTVIIELKSVKALGEIIEAQIINYLKLSHLPLGYLINFNALRVDWKRFVNTQGSA